MKILLLFFITLNLFGHSLKIYVQEDNATSSLQIISFFKKESPCIECEAIITQGTKKDRLKTNKDGEVFYKLSSNNPITIEVNAGAGHYKKIDYTPTITTQNKDDEFLYKILYSFVSMIFIFLLLYRLKK